ncbi:MAG: helix-turn-helix transcriptional regulator [Bacteroidota bacterium]|nr:helix-turn-helix transcriptional regulator [Bacteroidota bacterium]
MDELNKRVLSVMEAKNLSRTAFASLLEISLPVLTHIGSGRNKPGLELIQKILTHFPDIDPDWLLLGLKTMFREKAEKPDISSELNNLNNLNVKLDQISANSRQVIDYNAILLKEINYLQELNQYMVDNEKRVLEYKRELEAIHSGLLSKLKD